MNQNKTNFGEKYSATREYLRQFETGKKRSPKSDQQYYRNCAVKEAINDDETFKKMTQEEKNNYYKSLK